MPLGVHARDPERESIVRSVDVSLGSDDEPFDEVLDALVVLAPDFFELVEEVAVVPVVAEVELVVAPVVPVVAAVAADADFLLLPLVVTCAMGLERKISTLPSRI